MRLHPYRAVSPARRLMNRLDRAAAELNVILIVIAVGLGLLDLTCLSVLKIEDALPPITRISAPPGPDASAPANRP